jgi:hypothetical protein
MKRHCRPLGRFVMKPIGRILAVVEGSTTKVQIGGMR